jgi:hypothetical protein
VVVIAVFDEDLAVDDLVWACRADPLLRSGTLVCNGGALAGASAFVDVRPN